MKNWLQQKKELLKKDFGAVKQAVQTIRKMHREQKLENLKKKYNLTEKGDSEQ